ncbi:juvenile hormone esterase-like [Cylas formicarius]|uniref:juvenile hormone esterase-like n=1 Tax=Cylas formicarius TaxID=197179 RepID=UPI002958770E|nr:juvenile hormone esterase-like [Cylas formicarius]
MLLPYPSNILTAFTILSSLQLALAVQVTISNGPIIGREAVTVNQNKTFYAFQGIPYASAPVGSLRFAAPVPPQDWTEPRNATTNGSICLQLQNNEVQGSEDCLFINVYTPKLDSTANLPVMAWIHGGYFMFGDSNYETYGPDYFIEQDDVVIVTFNYRLGIFGFLSTEDDAALGNWALKDQIMALQWVQTNIKLFGGDPGSITLFGQSAGSASVSYLCQTSKATGLFHRAILESGSSLDLWSLARKPKETAFAVGSLLGLTAFRTSDLISRLRQVDAVTLLTKSITQNLGQTLFTNPRDGLVFAPSTEPDVDEAVVVGKSHEKLSEGSFLQIPYMMGFTSQEAIALETFINQLRIYLLTYDAFPRRLIPIDMNIIPVDVVTLAIVATSVKDHYLGFIPAVLSTTQITQYVTDDQFVRGIYEMARLMSARVPVYLYRFSYEGLLGNPSRNGPGVSHAEELNYLWRREDSLQSPPEEDIVIRNKLVRLWINFAKFSNPTPEADSLLDNAIWPVALSNNVSYFDIGANFQISSNFNNYSIPFWTSLYDRYGRPPYDTY